jgi:hypothetical protein
MVKDKARLAYHVSRNEAVTFMSEDDEEGIKQAWRGYIASGDEVMREQYLKKAAGKWGGIIGQCLNHEETRLYMGTIFRFVTHFSGYKKIFSAKWMKEHLHDVLGGVSI